MNDAVGREALDVEALVNLHSEALTSDLSKVLAGHASEEDVRIAVASRIGTFASDAGLSLRARHEYGLAGGRIDSKYGGLIIEYKNPSGADRLDGTGSARGTKAVEHALQARHCRLYDQYRQKHPCHRAHST